MDLRDHYINCLTFVPNTRPLFWHMYGLMPRVLERWHSEGLPPSIGEEQVGEYFGFDGHPYGRGPVVLTFPVDFDPPFPQRVIEETDRYIIRTGGRWGTTEKIMKGIATIFTPIDHPLKQPSDWLPLKKRLQFSKPRVGTSFQVNVIEQYEKARSQGLPVSVNLSGFFWVPRFLMGEFRLFRAYYRDPDLVHDILETYTNLIVAVAEQLPEGVEVDEVHWPEDMAYRHGPMISPKHIKEFMLPYYRRVINVFRQKGTRIFSVDSDGNVEALIPLLIEAGINVISPLEVQAGNNLVGMRRRYGRKMAYVGGINKLILTQNFDAIENELEVKLPLMRETGGYMAGLDHRVVPQTPLKNFQYYVRRVKEIIGK